MEKRSCDASEETKQLALKMYLEGMGLRSIGRGLNFSNVAVLYWVREYGESVELPVSEEPISAVELDEMHTYVNQKKVTAGCGSRSTERAKGT